MKKRIIRIIVYFILGYILFNIIISITKFTILKFYKLDENFISILLNALTDNLFIYTILFFMIIIGIFIYDKSMVKKLNDKLKERRNKNEQ